MPSYKQYKHKLSVLDKEEWITIKKNGVHVKIEEGETAEEAIENKFGNALQNTISEIKNKNIIPSNRKVELGAKTLKNIDYSEAVRLTESVYEYTANDKHGDRANIEKFIKHSPPANVKTWSGIEKKHLEEFVLGQPINQRLISWSKDQSKAEWFAKETDKVLVLEKNTGADITDISAEPEEQEVLTSKDDVYIITKFTTNNNIQYIHVEKDDKNN